MHLTCAIIGFKNGIGVRYIKPTCIMQLIGCLCCLLLGTLVKGPGVFSALLSRIPLGMNDKLGHPQGCFRGTSDMH